MEGAVESHNATMALGAMLDAFAPKQEQQAPVETMTVKSVFDRITEAFQADKAAGVDVVFQYRISGPGGGDWNVSVKDGRCEAREGAHPSPTTTILMSAEDFLSLMQRKLNAMQAYTSGKLKIQGDLMKSQLIEKLFRF